MSPLSVKFLFIAQLCIQLAAAIRQRRGMTYEDMVANMVVDSYKMRSTIGRPVRHFNDTVIVEFAIQLQQIMALDEQEQVLTLNVWDQYQWQDAQISWDPKEYGEVLAVRLPCEKIWTPDIKLHNYADLRLKEHRETLCIINATGFVYNVPQVVYRSSCPIDVYYFPYDIQNCTLRFGSWGYPGNLVDVQFYYGKEWVDLTEYVESNAWFIVDCPGYRFVNTYTCCPGEFYVLIEYYLVFKRRPTFYNYILIIPCILLTSITLILFWIPPESPAKMQLGLAVFIAFFILLRLLEKNLPPGTSRMPLLGTYYCLNMILITLSSFLNVLIVDLTTHGLRTAKTPRVKKFFFNYLAKCLFMEDLVKPFQVAPKLKTRTPRDPNLARVEECKWVNEMDPTTEAVIQLQRDQSIQIGGPLAEIDGKLCELREFIRLQKQRLKDRDHKESTAKQWKAVALILDRIFFFVYLIIIIVSLGYTLPVLTSRNTEVADIVHHARTFAPG